MDVMTARVDVEALDIDDDWRELCSGEICRIRASPCMRTASTMSSAYCISTAFTRRCSTIPTRDIRSNLMKPLYIYKTVKLPDVLAQLRKNQQHPPSSRTNTAERSAS